MAAEKEARKVAAEVKEAARREAKKVRMNVRCKNELDI